MRTGRSNAGNTRMVAVLIVALLAMVSLVAFEGNGADAAQVGSVNEGGVTYTCYYDGSIRTASAMATSTINTLTDIVIKDIVSYGGEDYTVTDIPTHGFTDSSGIAKITLPAKLETIGDYAFTRCYGMTVQNSGTIPSSVTSIGEGAFGKCGNLQKEGGSVIIPDGVTVLSNGVFAECGNITSMTLSKNLTSIGASAFDRCSNMTVQNPGTIPSSVKSIGNYAFDRCSKLQNEGGSVIIPDDVKVLGDYVFAYCGNITSMTLPANLETIGDYAFAECSDMVVENTGTIPSSVKSIGTGAFSGCKNLQNEGGSVRIPDDVKVLNMHAFAECSNIKSMTLSKNLTSIGVAAFAGCSNMTVLNAGTIPSSVKSIGNYAFDRCSKLQNEGGRVIIPDSVTVLGDYVFANCSNITSMTLPANLETIGECAFVNCSNMTVQNDGTIPSSVKTIGDLAFGSCSKLQNEGGRVIIPDGVTVLGNRVFTNCSNITSMTLSKNLTSIGAATFADCSNMVVQNTGTIPSSVKIIGSYAFYGCSKLQDNNGRVIIPDSVTVLSECVFVNCSNIERMTLPANLETISNDAFRGCTNMTVQNDGTIPSSVKIIGSYAFYGCSNLQKADGNVVIPCKDVGSAAFVNCSNIDNITVPDEITGSFNISDLAFKNNDDNTTTYFKGGKIVNSSVDGGNGTISPSGNVLVHNSSKMFTFTPNAGYAVKTVMFDGTDVTSNLTGLTYTVSNPSDNAKIVVSFVQVHVITASAGINGSISPSGSISVEHGANQIFTITPNAGYEVDVLTVDDTPIASVASYTFSDVTTNHTINVTFKLKTYTVTLSDSNGTISLTSINHGAVYNGTISANSGYGLPANVTVKVGGSDLNSSGFTYAQSTGVFKIADGANVTGNIAITITFVTSSSPSVPSEPSVPSKPVIDIITVAGSTGGTVSGGGSYANGSTIIIEAIPQEGYGFLQWNDGNTEAKREVSVSSSSTYEATFAKIATVVVEKGLDIKPIGKVLVSQYITLPDAPASKGGMVFKGWKINDSTYQPGYRYQVTEEYVEMFAVWSIDSPSASDNSFNNTNNNLLFMILLMIITAIVVAYFVRRHYTQDN